MEDVTLEQKAKLASQLSRLSNFVNKNKLKISDVTVTGLLACKMHGIVDGDVNSDVIEVLVKRKVFMKLAKASEFDNQMIAREDFSIHIIRNDEFMDTICLDNFKVISLNQIVKELKNEPALLSIMNKAKDKLEGQSTMKFEDVKKPRNGISDRDGMSRRLKKGERYIFDRPGMAYRR